MNNIPEVHIDGTAIFPGYIKELHLIQSMKSLFPRGALRFQDPSMTYINKIKLGSEIQMTFFKDDGRVSLKTKLGVLPLEKMPSKNPAFIDTADAALISQWYFDQTLRTSAHFGSVSEITRQVLKDNRFFKSLDITLTSDVQRVRYRIKESIAEFLDRIAKYATIDNSPVYMYATSDRVLHLVSHNSLLGKGALVQIRPYLDTQAVGALGSNLDALMAFTQTFRYEGQQAASGRLEVFQADIQPKAEIEQASLAIGTRETDVPHTWETPNDATITNWNISPAEAAAIAINRSNQLDNLLLDVTVIVPYSNIKLADVVDVNLNSAGFTESGLYFVETIDTFFNEGSLLNKLHLVFLKKG